MEFITTEDIQSGKAAFMSDHLLVHSDLDKPLLLACDVSPYKVGVVLSHQHSDGADQPISYAS